MRQLGWEVTAAVELGDFPPQQKEFFQKTDRFSHGHCETLVKRILEADGSGLATLPLWSVGTVSWLQILYVAFLGSQQHLFLGLDC